MICNYCGVTITDENFGSKFRGDCYCDLCWEAIERMSPTEENGTAYFYDPEDGTVIYY